MTQKITDIMASLLKCKLSQLIELRMNVRVVVILAVFVFFLGIVYLSPLTTTGAIYVDSPEIYTRERLVNDRYEQDFWLHQQLGNLDKTQNLVTGEIDLHSSGVISNSTNPTATSVNSLAASDSQQKTPRTLTFAQEFAIRAASRDAIRQLVLENMLDDRHDLTGNSVYGLKFDTTVIPGVNTIGRAFVRINLSVEDPFKIELEQYKNQPTVSKVKYLIDEYQQLPKHVIVYYAQTYVEDSGISSSSPLYAANQQYNAWLKSIEDRLNTYMHRKISSDEFEKQCKGAENAKKFDQFKLDTISDNVDHVLSVPNGVEFKGDQIHLPEPWSNYIQIFYDMKAESCETQPIFTVREKWDYFNLFDKKRWPSASGQNVPTFYKRNTEDEDPKKCGDYVDIRSHSTKEHILAYIADPKPEVCDTKGVSDYLQNNKLKTLSYLPSNEFIAFTDKINNIKCIDKQDQIPCPNDNGADGRTLTVPSGLFNFIEKLVDRDLYSYAVFPKNEVAGILSNSSVDLAVSGEAHGSASLNFGKDVQESRLESMSVGFGDGSKGNLNDEEIPDKHRSKKDKQDNIEFGWAMSGLGKMEPTQKTQLALISVPAWTNKLNLKITTGWLDRNSQEIADKKPFEMKVPVPPDYQAFDSLIIEGQHQRKPKILNNLMDAGLKVFACENAKILIPGSRLWRSAAVTLGAQKADRITVLPNMEGIIAEFLQVEFPHSGKGSTPKVKLQVWTSEGVDTAVQEVEIQVPSGNGHSCPKKAVEPPVAEKGSTPN